MCQTARHSLGDRERKILKDYGLMGRVVALRNIVMLKKIVDVILFSFVFLSREIQIQLFKNFGQEHDYFTMY